MYYWDDVHVQCFPKTGLLPSKSVMILLLPTLLSLEITSVTISELNYCLRGKRCKQSTWWKILIFHVIRFLQYTHSSNWITPLGFQVYAWSMGERDTARLKYILRIPLNFELFHDKLWPGLVFIDSLIICCIYLNPLISYFLCLSLSC